MRSGLHHVTAAVGNPERDADFSVGTPGAGRRTVTHDGAGTYYRHHRGDGGN